MSTRSGYPLGQKLADDVVVGGNAVWSRYRRYPVFSARWLRGRTLLFLVPVLTSAILWFWLYLALHWLRRRFDVY